MRRFTACLRIPFLLIAFCLGSTVTAWAQPRCQPNATIFSAISAGAAALNARDFSGAVAAYDCALELDPSLSDAYLGRGMALLLLGDFRSGGRDINAAVDNSSLSDDEFSGEQIARIQVLSDADPQNADLLSMLGYWQWWSAQDENAVETFDRLLQLDPESVLGHVYRGSALLYLGYGRAADRAFAEAVRLSNGSDSVYAVMAQTQLNTSNYTDALASATRAISRRPDEPAFYTIRGDAYRFQRNFSAAMTDYQRALDLNPRFMGALVGAAYASDGQNDIAGARGYIARALEVQPNNTRMLLLRGQIALDLREYTDAETDFLRVVELNPAIENAWIGLADARMARGFYAEAGQAYRQVIDLNPDNLEAARRLIEALELSGDAQGAAQTLNEFLIRTREEFVEAGLIPVKSGKVFNIGPAQAFVLTLEVPTPTLFVTIRAESSDPGVDPVLVLRTPPANSGFLSSDNLSDGNLNAEIRTMLTGPGQIQIVVAVNNPEGGLVTVSVE